MKSPVIPSQSLIKKYQVSFIYNNGDAIKQITVQGGKTITEPFSPVRRGYIFKGWYLGKVKYNFDTKVVEDVQLQAKWMKVSVKKTKITSIKRGKNRKLVLTLKKIKGINGYRVSYSYRKNLRKAVKVKEFRKNKI